MWVVIDGPCQGLELRNAGAVELLFEEDAPTGLVQAQHDGRDVLKLPSGKIVAEWRD